MFKTVRDDLRQEITSRSEEELQRVSELEKKLDCRSKELESNAELLNALVLASYAPGTRK